MYAYEDSHVPYVYAHVHVGDCTANGFALFQQSNSNVARKVGLHRRRQGRRRMQASKRG